MLTPLPPPFTGVLGSLWFPSLFNFSSRIHPKIQDARGNDVHKAEQTTLSKVCISAHKIGLLLPYTPPTLPRLADQNHNHAFTVMYDTTEFCSSHITFWHYHSYFSNFLFCLGICFTLWIISCTLFGHEFQNLSHLHNPEGLWVLLLFSPILFLTVVQLHYKLYHDLCMISILKPN